MTILFWGQLMEQLVGFLQKRPSGSTFIFIMLICFAAYAWAGEEFVRKTEFNELKTLMVSHTEEFRINNASQIIRDLKTDIRIAKATSAPVVEVDRLEDQLDHAERYKDCLVDRKPNCKHLLQPE